MFVCKDLGSEINGTISCEVAVHVMPNWKKKYAMLEMKTPRNNSPIKTALSCSACRRDGESVRGKTKKPGYSEDCSEGSTTSRAARLRRCLNFRSFNSVVCASLDSLQEAVWNWRSGHASRQQKTAWLFSNLLRLRVAKFRCLGQPVQANDAHWVLRRTAQRLPPCLPSRSAVWQTRRFSLV